MVVHIGIAKSTWRIAFYISSSGSEGRCKAQMSLRSHRPYETVVLAVGVWKGAACDASRVPAVPNGVFHHMQPWMLERA
jgi:hypothetical protein